MDRLISILVFWFQNLDMMFRFFLQCSKEESLEKCYWVEWSLELNIAAGFSMRAEQCSLLGFWPPGKGIRRQVGLPTSLVKLVQGGRVNSQFFCGFLKEKTFCEGWKCSSPDFQSPRKLQEGWQGCLAVGGAAFFVRDSLGFFLVTWIWSRMPGVVGLHLSGASGVFMFWTWFFQFYSAFSLIQFVSCLFWAVVKSLMQQRTAQQVSDYGRSLQLVLVQANSFICAFLFVFFWYLLTRLQFLSQSEFVLLLALCHRCLSTSSRYLGGGG